MPFESLMWQAMLMYTSPRFLPMLVSEEAENEAVSKERLASWSFERLQQEGYCITDLTAYWKEDKHFDRPVATFSLGPGIMLPLDHRFE